MARRILVAYATKHGSTQEVAEGIAVTLGAGGADVDCVPAHVVETLEPYDAVVLGGALYTGRLHKEARRFLEQHRTALAGLPFAVFALGPQDLAPQKVADSRTQLDRALARFSDLRPESVAIFGGVVEPAKLSFPLNRMPASDARDWHAIDAWAEELSGIFASRAAARRG